MTIKRDFDSLLFIDTLFFATIRQLEEEEIKEGVTPKIKIWFSDKKRNENGPLAEILEIENNFKVWFDDHYGHSYITLNELSKFITWVIEEVMKKPHYMLGKIS
jgi:hypothetical protein